MSADKHRRLAIETAYLRLADAGLAVPADRVGFSVNIKWGRALTPEIRDMIAKGDLVLQRSGASGRKRAGKRVSCIVATEQGASRFAAIIARRGADFGRDAPIDRNEPVRIRKDERRKIDDTTPRHIKAARARAAVTASQTFIAHITRKTTAAAAA